MVNTYVMAREARTPRLYYIDITAHSQKLATEICCSR